MQKARIKAVYEDNIYSYLDRLGVLAKIRAGKMKCKFCQEPVKISNIHSLFPEAGQVKIVCDKPGCMAAFVEHMRESA